MKMQQIQKMQILLANCTKNATQFCYKFKILNYIKLLILFNFCYIIVITEKIGKTLEEIKMKKRILSVILATVLTGSMAAISAISASAIHEPTGEYTPGEGIETNRYYFYMPQDWYNEYTTSAGMYWWEGTDACGAVDGSGGDLKWPGYKAWACEDMEGVFYLDVPKDVTMVIWNNYVDGGEDKTAPIYPKALQTFNLGCEYYSDGDSEVYDSVDDGEFFANMEESFNGDKAALGEYADNFFDGEYGMSFTMDNMIFIVDPSNYMENELSGKLSYGGEWFFYYGDGTYGPYPTKEASEAAGLLGDISAPVATPDEAPSNPTVKPTVPAPGQDATSAVGGTSTNDSVKGDNTAIQTGAVSLAVVLLVILSAVSGVAVFTRKKFD